MLNAWTFFHATDRGEVAKGSAEIFFRKVKFWKEDEAEEAPPVFVSIFKGYNVRFQYNFNPLVLVLCYAKVHIFLKNMLEREREIDPSLQQNL